MQLFVAAKALVEHNGKVLLVRESTEYVEGSAAGKWDVVGGRIEPDEEVRVGLLREVKEECGLSVEPGVLLGVFDGFHTMRGETCHIVRIYFHCKAVHDEVTLSDDHDAYAWIDPRAVGDREFVGDIAEVLQVFNERFI